MLYPLSYEGGQVASVRGKATRGLKPSAWPRSIPFNLEIGNWATGLITRNDLVSLRDPDRHTTYFELWGCSRGARAVDRGAIES